MTISTLTGTYFVTVTPGSGNYGTTLTITDAAEIEPPAGANGVYVSASITGVSLDNAGIIRSGNGFDNGVVLESTASFTNSGLVSGGAFDPSDTQAPHGIGIYFAAGGTLINSGTIAGGTAGIGVDLGTGGNVTNRGNIDGGAGNFFLNTANPESGGAGIVVGTSTLADTTITNYGAIAGGYGQGTPIGIAGGGGIGVSLAGSGTLINDGSITGGKGGYVDYSYSNGSSVAGRGGAGVNLNGGTLVNAGTITGGAAGPVQISGPAGIAGDAVQFGSLAGTLVDDPGAIFSGDVVANSAVNDMLELAGTAAGTLTGLGTQFTGFTTLDVAAASDWTLQHVNTLGSATNLTVTGTLNNVSAFIDTGTATVETAGVLRSAVTGVTLVNGVTLAGGDLIDTADAKFIVGSDAAGAAAGKFTVKADGAITGFGYIAGAAVVDNGNLTASGGALDVTDAVSGVGRLTIDIGASLVLGAGVSGVKMVFAAGGDEYLKLDAVGSVSSFIVGFAATDKIDLKSILSTKLEYAGHTLEVFDGTKEVAALDFLGAYTLGDFQRSSDGHLGTLISFHS